MTIRKQRDILELSVGYGLILLVIWTPRPWQRLLYCTAVAWILAVTWTSFDGWKTMGLRSANLLRSLWVVGAALLAAATAIIFAGRLHTLHLPHGIPLFIRTYWGYAIWSLVQQILLQDFFLRRFLRLLPDKKSAVITTAGIFSLAHLPNPILVPVTWIWGLAACLLFLRYRNLYSLAMAHAIFGICIAVTVPGPVDHNMRVGLGYFNLSPECSLPTAAALTATIETISCPPMHA